MSVRGGQRPCGYKNHMSLQNPIAGCVFDWYHAGLTPRFLRPKHRWYMTKANVPCAKFATSLGPACGPIYQQCFETRCHFGGLCTHLTHTCRYHRIFEFVPEMSISSTFYIVKPRSRETKSHLPCRLLTFLWTTFLVFKCRGYVTKSLSNITLLEEFCDQHM